MIQSIQSLRGIFVVLIFLRHFRIDGSVVFPPGGDLGVAFFFILSGFVLRMRYAGREISYFGFLRKRFSKIYPLHLVCLAATCLILWSGLDAFVLNLFLVQSWVPEMGVYFSFNGVAWYLSTLLFAYVMFPILNRCIDRHTKLFYIVFLSITVCYVSLQPLIPESSTNFRIYVFPPSRLVDFTLGMCLFDSIRSIRLDTEAATSKRSLLINLAGAISVVLLIVSCIFYEDVLACYKLAAMWWIPLLLLIGSLTVMGNRRNLVNRALKLKPFVFMGKISFGFYMTHLLVMRVVETVIEKFDVVINGYLELCVVFSITAIASVVAEKFIVKTFSKH